MSGVQDIAVVSFAPFLSGDVAQQQAVADRCRKAFSDVGFLYLKDHGIPEEDVEAMFALTKRFFELPLEMKMKWRLGSAMNQGYSPEGAEAGDGVDHKESYEHRRFSNELCPTASEYPGFHETMDQFYTRCLTLSEQVMRCMALVIGLPTDYFDKMGSNADPQLRILHYFPIRRAELEQEKHARIIPHTDFGLCTLLFQDAVGGLEVDPWRTDDFKAIEPVPGAVLVNVADLLERLSNGRLKSTIHRVVAPKGTETAGGLLPARYSIPFFHHPDPAAVIEAISWEGEAKKYDTVVAGGSNGIGAATAEKFAAHGAEVVVGDISPPRPTTTTVPHITFQKTDVTSYQSILALFDTAFEKHGKIDIAISNAAIIEPPDIFGPTVDLDTVREEPNLSIVDVNVRGTLHFARIASVYLQQKRDPVDDRCLLLMSSVAGFTFTPGLYVYGATKHAILGLMRPLAPYASTILGYRVNCVCPWTTDTGMVALFRDAWHNNRFAMNSASDVADIYLGLAVDRTSNGKAIYVEGGRGWDVEEGLNKLGPEWLGRSAWDELVRGQEFFSNTDSWT